MYTRISAKQTKLLLLYHYYYYYYYYYNYYYIIRKKEKYKELNNTLQNKFKKVEFVNLSISALGVFAKESFAFQSVLSNLGLKIRYKNIQYKGL